MPRLNCERAERCRYNCYAAGYGAAAEAKEERARERELCDRERARKFNNMICFVYSYYERILHMLAYVNG